MTNMGRKEALVKIKDTKIGLPDTVESRNMKDLEISFRDLIQKQDRVLKISNGSSGEGVWIIRVPNREKMKEITDETLLNCASAYDNHEEMLTIKQIVKKCEVCIIISLFLVSFINFVMFLYILV